MNLFALVLRLCVAAAALLAAPSLQATAYEAALPAELHSAKKLCDFAPCAEVFPGATSFSERKGQPPYVEAYASDQGKARLLGYVMLSTDITDTPAYSGKPVVTLIGMDLKGRFVGVKVLKHSEPILLLGIPETALTKFNDQYLGQFVGDKIEIGHSRPEEGIIGLDAISGATVTVIAQNQVMMASGGAVARQTGILAPTIRPQAKFTKFIHTDQAPNWAALVKEGSVQRLAVRPEQVGLDRSSTPFIELWFGYLNQPDIGRALLGETGWAGLMAQLKPGEHALFVIRTQGAESFKGSGFVRGGIYDRVQVRQGLDTFTFRDLDYLNLYGLEAAGAPSFNESAIFIVRSPAFSAAFPWRLSLLSNRVDRATGTRSFANFDAEYWLPASALEGGRPVIDKPDAAWLKVWKARVVEIVLFVALLVGVAVVYALRDQLTRRSTRKNKWPVNAFKYSAWLISIGFVGFGLMAQPSITQVLTWFHALLFHWTWELFLSDPFVFLFWIFIIVTVFVWGRGLFCGQTRSGVPFALLHLMGRVFMDSLDCPFRTAEAELARLPAECRIRIVDFHAEASSEKQAFAWHMDGRLTAVIGTHTHVPTADERVLPAGTAFITDVGMTGPYESVIGVEKQIAIRKFLNHMPARFEPAKGDLRLCAVVIEAEEATGRARSIERLMIHAS